MLFKTFLAAWLWALPAFAAYNPIPNPLPVSQSGAWSIALPTGASTSALQTSGNASLTSIDGKTPALGQALMADSVPVAISSDQSAIPASQSGTWNITNVSGTVSLPTGAAVSAKQPALGTAGTPSADVITVQGAASMTALKVDGSAVTQPVSAASLPLPTGAATSASQTTGNTSLATIATNSAKAPINTTGSYAEITNLTTAAQTFTAPANAVGFVLMALSDNSVNVRWKVGGTATTSAGMRLEPGRDTGYIPVGANVSVIAESGSSQIVNITWVAQ